MTDSHDQLEGQFRQPRQKSVYLCHATIYCLKEKNTFKTKTF